MKKLKYTILLPAVLALVACTSGTKGQNTEASGTGVTNNPETGTPNTSIKAAFPGQTRIRGVKTTTPYSADVIIQGLGKPWSVNDFPSGKLIVTDKEGVAYLLNNGKIETKITGFPTVDASGQGGLLDLALDPNFATNRMIYWSFSEPANGGNHTAVGKGKLSADNSKIENATVIFRAIPTYDGDKHYGSRLAFDREGFLFVSTGERSDLKTRPLAQDQTKFLGKILRISTNGTPAQENAAAAGWKPEIYSTGHRNPQGIVIHPVTGELWEAEMGPRGGDEINLIKRGKNYGWPTITYGEEYSGLTIGEGIGQKEGLEQPVYYWDPSVSMSGIDFYQGNIAEWKNNLIIGCLGGQKIIRLVISDNRVTGEEWLLEDKKERFRDVLSSADGNLYAVTDSGKLYKISKK